MPKKEKARYPMSVPDDVKAVMRRIRKIEITTRALAEGAHAGLHSSLFRAQGIEFASLRQYVPGDDIRAIDWKVTARKNHPFVRTFTEDREQTFYFVVDRSGSGSFGSTSSKDDRMVDVAASLMFAAWKNHERIGLCIFTDRVECFMKARQGRAHLIHLLSVLISHRPPGKNTDISSMISFLSKNLNRRCSVIILSDFYSPSFEASLRILRNHHEVIAIRIADEREKELPDIGLVALEDLETGEQILIDTSDGAFRSRYREIASREDSRIRSILRKCHTGTVTLMSGDPSLVPLRRFFSSRRQGR
jgi:uncharacterized protein (DUF58 family)